MRASVIGNHLRLAKPLDGYTMGPPSCVGRIFFFLCISSRTVRAFCPPTSLGMGGLSQTNINKAATTPIMNANSAPRGTTRADAIKLVEAAITGAVAIQSAPCFAASRTKEELVRSFRFPLPAGVTCVCVESRSRHIAADCTRLLRVVILLHRERMTAAVHELYLACAIQYYYYHHEFPLPSGIPARLVGANLTRKSPRVGQGRGRATQSFPRQAASKTTGGLERDSLNSSW